MKAWCTRPRGLLSQTVNTLGQTVQKTLDTTGNLVEKTLDTTGKVVNQRTIGSVLDTAATGLRVVSETTNSSGQTVRRLQDASGGIVEVVLDSAGKIVSSRILSGPPTRDRRHCSASFQLAVRRASCPPFFDEFMQLWLKVAAGCRHDSRQDGGATRFQTSLA